MRQNLRDSLDYVLKHPHTSVAGVSPSVPHIIRSYVIAAATIVGILAVYTPLYFSDDPTLWAWLSLLDILLFTAVIPIAAILGWGPGLTYSGIMSVFSLLLLSDVHRIPAKIVSVWVAVTLMMLTINFVSAGLRLSWSLYNQRSHEYIDSLKDVNLRLEEEIRAKDDFINTASHELRTPLTALALTSQLLNHHLPPSEAALLDAKKLRLIRGHITLMTAQIARVVASLTDMTDSVHMERGTLVMSAIDLDICQLVGTVVEECRILFEDHTIQFNAPVDPLWVRGDTYRLAQVVYHYISNACKYSPLASTVDVNIYRENERVVVTVVDRGQGVPYEKQEEIWGRYYHTAAPQQAHSSFVGLGLGLYISKTTIEQHGGTVGVRSAVGSGSVFWFTLPLVDSDDPKSQIHNAPDSNIVSFLQEAPEPGEEFDVG